jgi:hypothetical protein
MKLFGDVYLVYKSLFRNNIEKIEKINKKEVAKKTQFSAGSYTTKIPYYF